MKRTFTVELDEDEAATIWQIAALTGLPGAQIVRELHRRYAWFQFCVDLHAGRGELYDEDTDRMVPLVPGGQEQTFREAVGTLMRLNCRSA